MSRPIAVGIDIGTFQVKVMAANHAREGGILVPRVVGVGYAETKGLRHGYIQSVAEVAKGIEQAKASAEKSAGVKFKRCFLSVGGIGLASLTVSGSIIISRADSEITDLDVKKAVDASQSEIPQSFSLNRRILHTVPLQFKIDGRSAFGNPVGMKGNKLEVRTLFITCLEHHLNTLVEAVQESGLVVDDVVAAPIAASLVTLTKTQKIAGCVLANIGSETVSIVVFENNLPISVEVFPFGSNDITNDIALGLKIPLEEAEEVKRGSIIGGTYPKKKLEDIIEARLSDIFDLIEAHLKKIGRSGLLPAGIVLTGGGSSIETIDDLAKGILKLPARRATVNLREDSKGPIKDASWSVAYGLCLLGLSEEGEDLPGVQIVKKTRSNVLNWLKQFLP